MFSNFQSRHVCGLAHATHWILFEWQIWLVEMNIFKQFVWIRAMIGELGSMSYDRARMDFQLHLNIHPYPG